MDDTKPKWQRARLRMPAGHFGCPHRDLRGNGRELWVSTNPPGRCDKGTTAEYCGGWVLTQLIFSDTGNRAYVTNDCLERFPEFALDVPQLDFDTWLHEQNA